MKDVYYKELLFTRAENTAESLCKYRLELELCKKEAISYSFTAVKIQQYGNCWWDDIQTMTISAFLTLYDSDSLFFENALKCNTIQYDSSAKRCAFTFSVSHLLLKCQNSVQIFLQCFDLKCIQNWTWRFSSEHFPANLQLMSSGKGAKKTNLEGEK